MSSLVAYEDSDSDTDGSEKDRSPCPTGATERSAGQQVSSKVPSDFTLHPTYVNSYSRTPSTGQGLYPAYSTVQTFPGKALQTTDVRSNNPDTTFRNVELIQQKRPLGSGVRPYIPKRLRQEQCSVVEEISSDRTGNSHDHAAQSTRSVYRVSDYLGPHLQLKYKDTEIPRSVVFQMGEHTGPVNRVQWCPVKQYSHLLLSASMDATVKVWDGLDSGKCLRTITSHRVAVRDAHWSACGQKILTGGFDSLLHLTDVETGKNLFNANNEWKIGTVRFHPSDPNLFICGGFSPAVKAWDIRMNTVIHVYKASVQQHFDVLFLPGGNEFLSTTNSVSRDSADRTIIAWDFGTAAKISNQIFHERYTCPSLALHPKENVFIAQTNGNYIALFSTQRPYKMNKRKRYEGHKVEGFAVGCEFSPDGSLIVTGSSDGSVYFYNYHTSKMVRSLPGDGNACVSINCHPVLTSLVATAHWDGQIRVWQ
ncbi:PREDICTED: WD repeat-containing protein 25 [Nanorana parkeri]|uniref:WD repeat-containing protein 25 n=1 Tax=Nanorana parkeri TaxID=125878 RepID=UPI000854B348|nr:PREDICTED: WD repeat-containing protein 25 [Nanorana parkeri]